MSAARKQRRGSPAASGKAGTKTKWIEPRLPAESVKYLALGIFRHEVFTSRQVEGKEQHLLPSIFPALRSFTNERQREFNAHPPSLIYAYTKDSLNGRTVNGYPVFSTVGLLWQRDAEMLAEQYKRIKATVDAAMDEHVKPEPKPTSRPATPVPPAVTTQRLLSVKDFGALLGVSLWTVRGWAYKGQVASVKLGARMMIPTAELDRLITENLRPVVSREH
jgi:hypothetical protein